MRTYGIVLAFVILVAVVAAMNPGFATRTNVFNLFSEWAPAGIMALSGFVPTVEGWQPDIAARAGLPVVIAHGTQDPVIGVDFARRARALLEAGGAAVEYHETPMAHTIDPRVITDLARWLVATTTTGS